ncbi:hypothetical protein K7432_002942 [Basidiobolus ranarum]|uniref:Breast cancer type 2 susceptibility protein n=1 Tax=Basidiobolus ranarum TaxID=34480 RepID=A0ABR2W7D4_9FUNG
MGQSKERNFSFQCPRGNTFILQKFYNDGTEQGHKNLNEDDDDDDGWWSVVPQHIQKEINEKFHAEQIVSVIEETSNVNTNEELHTPETQRYYKIKTPSTRLQTSRNSDNEELIPTQQTTQLIRDKTPIYEKFSPESVENLTFGNKTPSRNSEKFKSLTSTPTTVLMNSNTSSRNRYSHSIPGSPLSHMHDGDEDLSPYISISKLLDQNLGDSPGWLSSPTQRVQFSSSNSTQIISQKPSMVSTPFAKIRRFSFGGVSRQSLEHSPSMPWSPLDTPSRVKSRKGLQEWSIDDGDNVSTPVEYLRNTEDNPKQDNILDYGSTKQSIINASSSSSNSTEHQEEAKPLDTLSIRLPSRSPNTPTTSGDIIPAISDMILLKSSDHMSSSNPLEFEGKEAERTQCENTEPYNEKGDSQDSIPLDSVDLGGVERSLSPSLFENTSNHSEHSSADSTDLPSDGEQCEDEEGEICDISNLPHNTSSPSPNANVEQISQEPPLPLIENEVVLNSKGASNTNNPEEKQQDCIGEDPVIDNEANEQHDIQNVSELEMNVNESVKLSTTSTQVESDQHEPQEMIEKQSTEVSTSIEEHPCLFEITAPLDLTILESKGFRTGSGRLLPLPNKTKLREAEHALLLNEPINVGKSNTSMFRAKTLGALAQEAKIKSLYQKNVQASSKIAEHDALTIDKPSGDNETLLTNKRVSDGNSLINSDSFPPVAIISKKPRLMEDQASETIETNPNDNLFSYDEKPDFNAMENTLLTFGGFSTGKGKRLQPPDKASLRKAMGVFEAIPAISTSNSNEVNDLPGPAEEQSVENDSELIIQSPYKDRINTPNNAKRSLADTELLTSSKKRSLKKTYPLALDDYNDTDNTFPSTSMTSEAVTNPLAEDLRDEFHDLDVATIVSKFGGFTSGFRSGLGSSNNRPPESNEVVMSDTFLNSKNENNYMVDNIDGSLPDSSKQKVKDVPLTAKADTPIKRNLFSGGSLSIGNARAFVSPFKSPLQKVNETNIGAVETSGSTEETPANSFTCGFSTGGGKKLNPPSEDAMKKASSIFHDLDEKDPLPSFSTSSGKKLATPSKSSLERAYKLFSDTDEANNLNTSPSHDHPAILSNLGFSTGTGKKLAAPSESSLQKAKELFNQDVLDPLDNDIGFANETTTMPSPKKTGVSIAPVQTDNQPYSPSPFSKNKVLHPIEARQRNIEKSPSSSRNPQDLSKHDISIGQTSSTPQRNTSSVEELGTNTVEYETNAKNTPTHPFRPAHSRIGLKPMFKTPIRKSTNVNNTSDSNFSFMKSPIDKNVVDILPKAQFSTPKPARKRLTKPFKSPMMSPRPKTPINLPVVSQKMTRLPDEEISSASALPSRSSDIFNMNATTSRISLRSFLQYPANKDIDELRKHNLPVEIVNIDPSNAAQYCFKNSTTDSQSKFTDDRWGFEDAHKEMMSLGCKSPQFSDRWTENHYRWIIWKIASFIRSYPAKFSKWWSPERVMNQLRYRYEKEINLGHRSALKRIIERDDSPAKPMVLCVSAIIENKSLDTNNNRAEAVTDDAIQAPSKYVLELTDGWYSLRTHIDKPLQRAIDSKKLQIGYKLSIVGARLVGSTEATPALEVSESTCLKISSNSCRIALWDAKLGYCRSSFKVSLGAISAEGGLIPCVDVIVMRKYPMCYMEIQPDGSKVFRNAKDEEVKERENQDQIAAEARTLLDRYTLDKKTSTSKPSGKKKNVENIESGQELYEEMSNQLDPAGFLENLTPTQKVRLEQYMLQNKEQQRSEMMQEINERLESSKHKRNVVPFFKIRVCDCSVSNYPGEATITIWRPDLSTYDMLLEGHRYKVYSLSASNKTISSFSLRKQIHLTATRTTSWKETSISSEARSESLFSPREAIGCIKLDEFNRGQEADMALVVLSVNCFSNHSDNRLQDISIFASDCSQNVIQINTNGKAGHLKPNDIVGFVNLLYIRKDPVRNVHVLSVTQDTEIKPFTRIAHLRQTGLSIEDWTKRNPEHVKRLIAYTEDIPEHSNVTHTDLLTQSPAPYVLTPLIMRAELPNASVQSLPSNSAHNVLVTPCIRPIPGSYHEQSSPKVITGSIINVSIVSEASKTSNDIALCIDDGVQIWFTSINRQSFKVIDKLADAQVHSNLETLDLQVPLKVADLQAFVKKFVQFKQEKVYPILTVNRATPILKINAILMTASLIDPQSLYDKYLSWLQDQNTTHEKSTASPTDDEDYTIFFTTLIDITQIDSNADDFFLPMLQPEWDHFSDLFVSCMRQVTFKYTLKSSGSGWELETMEAIDPRQRTVDLLKQLDHILDL